MQKQYIYIVLVVSICLESGSSKESSETADEDEEGVMDHTFVALIDIVYTDGSKRSCTGAIIDDNVVVTAAHCFETETETQPELTASFVVIGTKKMFDTGYEQYLPIERVLTHPRFHGWTADISLVYTFATMTADKPGTVIALAGEKIGTHVDTNATVLSWGRYGDDNNFSTKSLLYPYDKKYNQKKKQDSCESSGYIKDVASRESRDSQGSSNHKNSYEHRVYKKARPLPTQQDATETHHNTERSRTTRPTHVKDDDIKKIWSRYLASDDEVPLKPPANYDEEITERRPRAEQEPSVPIAKQSLDSYLESIWNKVVSTQNESKTTTGTPDTSFQSYYKSRRRKMPTETEIETTTVLDTSYKSYYKNWRRQMPTQQNSLLVEIFSFVNQKACIKLIEKGMSSNYDFSQEKDFLCYASEEHYISDKDSGAPAVRHGQLVAVTVGGVECEGDHVGIGMKIACYCSWIAENVPNGKNMTCCKNCCGMNGKKADKNENSKNNKYSLR